MSETEKPEKLTETEKPEKLTEEVKNRFVNFAQKLVSDVSITNQDFFTSGTHSMSSRAKKITP